MPNPKSPVVKGLEDHEIVKGQGQPQYQPLPVLQSTIGRAMSRWEFTHEEREAIAIGADLYITVSTFGDPIQPIRVDVCAEEDSDELVEVLLREPDRRVRQEALAEQAQEKTTSTD